MPLISGTNTLENITFPFPSMRHIQPPLCRRHRSDGSHQKTIIRPRQETDNSETRGMETALTRMSSTATIYVNGVHLEKAKTCKLLGTTLCKILSRLRFCFQSIPMGSGLPHRHGLWRGEVAGGMGWKSALLFWKSSSAGAHPYITLTLL